MNMKLAHLDILDNLREKKRADVHECPVMLQSFLDKQTCIKTLGFLKKYQ